MQLVLAMAAGTVAWLRRSWCRTVHCHSSNAPGATQPPERSRRPTWGGLMAASARTASGARAGAARRGAVARLQGGAAGHRCM